MLQQELRSAVARHLMQLAAGDDVALRVREPAQRTLAILAGDNATGFLLRETLKRYAEDPARVLPALAAPRVPPGSPIGCEDGLESPASLLR